MTGARAGIADRAQSAAVATTAPKPTSLTQLIERQQSEVERALPTHLKSNAAAYIRALVTVVKQNPKLMRCDPLTVLGGLMTASQLGLEFGPLGLAYLLPYGNKAQLIIGYKGIIDLAWRSDRLKNIEAREVKENDEFSFSYGLEPHLTHTPMLRGDRGSTYAYYGVAHFDGGGHYFVVLSRSDIEEHRRRSMSKDNGPWVTDYDAMAKKTCIRVMQPYLPLTTEVQRALSLDGTVTTGATIDDLAVEHTDWIDAEAVEETQTPATGEIIDERPSGDDDPGRTFE